MQFDMPDPGSVAETCGVVVHKRDNQEFSSRKGVEP